MMITTANVQFVLTKIMLGMDAICRDVSAQTKLSKASRTKKAEREKLVRFAQHLTTFISASSELSWRLLLKNDNPPSLVISQLHQKGTKLG